MDLFSDDFSALVFKTSSKDKTGEIRLNAQMRSVLAEIDGIKNLAAITKILKITPENLKKIITQLYQLRLIETKGHSNSYLNNEFFDFLRYHLSLAVGPIARYIIEDEIQEFGGDLAKVPRHRAAELVDRLSRQIQRQEKKIAFQLVMIDKIKEIAN